MHNLNYPNTTTWFIAYTGDVYSYGSIDSNQCLTTGLANIETFDTEEGFLARAQELNLTISLQGVPPEEDVSSDEGYL